MTQAEQSVTILNGIGAKKAEALARLGLTTLGDLTRWYPRAYEDRRKIWPIRQAPEGEPVCVCAVVAQPPRTSYVRKGLSVTHVTVFDDSSSLSLTFFNQPYLSKQLLVGQSYVFYGALELNGTRRGMVNPVFEPEGSHASTGRIVPVYPLTAGISSRQLAGWIAQALTEMSDTIPDDLPPKLRLDHQLPARDWAIRTVHAPASFEELELARRRLVFEELFYLTAGLAQLHRRRQAGEGCLCKALSPNGFTDLLPYALTQAQQAALTTIFADLSSGKPMNRLLQGDVGSGKTVVAAGAVWLAAQSDWQSALMAPTEILAAQHYQTLSALFEGTDIRVGLLTGSMKVREKRDIRERLELGMLDLVVGTHALLSVGVDFARLGLVITDEQHRFGVTQRSALSAKGGRPHVLVMSATPIPRTLALIIYGDLDISIMNERPPGRQEVDTFLISEDKRERMQGFIRRQVQEGHQVYIVCPAVEESETEGASELKNVTAYAKQLQTEVFPDLRIGLVHGKLSAKAKEAAMAAFSAGETDILVATTVIEVGVDVPNATLMVIENADRFGLSQLHQLRGRVGRGKAKSYCVLLSANRSSETRQRLKALCATNDGFKIAEKDLELRGPGDFFGSRQHGLPQLQVADLAGDTRVLAEAKEAAEALLADDPELEKPENQPVLNHIRTLFEENPDIFN